MNIDLTKVLTVAMCVTGLVTIIALAGSCTIKEKQALNAQIQIYIDAKCDRQPISGISGTHWVCDGEKK